MEPSYSQLTLYFPFSSPTRNGAINGYDISQIQTLLLAIEDKFKNSGCTPALDAIVANYDAQRYEISLSPNGQFPFESPSHLIDQLQEIGVAISDPRTWLNIQMDKGARSSAITQQISLSQRVAKQVRDPIKLVAADHTRELAIDINPQPQVIYKDLRQQMNGPNPKQYHEIDVDPVATFGSYYAVNQSGEPVTCYSSMDRELLHTRGRWKASREKRTISVWVVHERLDVEEHQTDLDL